MPSARDVLIPSRVPWARDHTGKAHAILYTDRELSHGTWACCPVFRLPVETMTLEPFPGRKGLVCWGCIRELRAMRKECDDA